MGSPEDTAIRELELRSLQSEAEWFVECEIPKVGRRIKRVLQHCLAFLSPRGTKELELLADLVPRDGDDDIVIPSLESTNKLASFETQEGLKGFISVGGWSITAADISVKFPKWNKGAPLKATVSNSHPWRLYQLQNAYNFVKMTLNELNLLIKQCESAHSNLDPQNLNNNNNSNNINNNNINNLSNSNSFSSSPLSSSAALSALSALSSSPYSASFSSCSPLHNLAFTQQTALAAVNKVVGQVSKWMALARDSIMLPNKGLLFPHSLASNQGFQGFHPALPQDLHIEFSVCNAEIIISVYALYIGLGPPPSIDTPQKSQLVASVLSPSANRIKGVPEKGQLSPSSSSSSLGGGMRKNNSVGSLLNNFPATFSNFSHALSSSSSSSSAAHDKSSSSLSSFNSSSSSLSRVDEAHETNVMDITEGSAPSISISSLSNTPSDHRVSIGGTTYRTYSISQRGNPAWVAVLDQSEVHCIVPRVNHTLSLLTHAINSLADIEDKLVALSLL